MEKFKTFFSIQFILLFFGLMVSLASAQTFEVSRTDDPTPDGCSSGTDCSLREAIMAANDVASGTATIQLTGGQTYTLSRVNSDTSTDLDPGTADETSGSLKILNSDAVVRIEVSGSGMATIDADEIDRVFILYPDTDIEMDGLEITGGKPNGSSTAGGIMVIKNENLVITNSTITGNSAGDGNSYGAGMWIEGSTVAITGSTISNNTAGFQGGGLRIIRYNEEVTVNSDVTIENSTISNNDGGSYGGGIYSERADLTIIESTISQNQATGFGGGINISTSTLNDRKITIDRTTIDENLGGLGGGLDIGGGEVLIINSTISGNEADNFNGAGGIYAGNFSEAIIDIVNTTITNNTSGNIGGVINGSGGAVINFSNSIVANQANNDDDCSGTMTSKGNNLSSDETCGFTQTGDLQNSDPLLGPLQDNGGPVFTHAITGPLSPAVNNGSNALYTSEGGDLANDSDANGNDRVYDFGSGGIIDIGSFELQQDATFDGCPVTNEDKILFVKKGENGTGANWADALGELRDALALFVDETCTTIDVEEIWVSAGTYLPTDDINDREATFLMPGVDILGGFEGDETNDNQRDVESNISILSGDINDDDNLSGNSFHVVTSMDEGSAGLFDFTITGGNANGTAPHDKGGGLYASNGGIAMAYVLFENNYAETAGGGAWVIETVNRIGAQHPAFVRTTFRNNETGQDGGGLALEDSESRMTAVTFENNTANRYGGGLFNDGADPVLKNVIFKENYADLEGGGILNTNSSPELFNVLIINNDANVNGGGIVNAVNASPVLTNVTISGNSAGLGNGGGMYNRNVATPTLINTIVWGNMAGGTGNEIWNSSNSTAVLNFSLYGDDTGDIVEGDGFTANNSITSEPNFTDNSSGDFTLLGTSPAINTGDPDTEMSDFKLFGPDEIDLAENPRVFNGTTDIIDMGAYEFQGEPVAPSSCPATDNILYVKKGESGTGASWDNALGELRDVYALFDSEDCTTDDVDEIWVAAGTYLPTDNSSDRTASFSVINDIDLFGGFEGVNSETSLEDRDWETNVTVLSGDIDEGSDLDGNSYHVVEAVEIDTETMLDGFTISGGNADLVDANNNFIGGGLYVNNSILTVINTIFENNFAEFGGGGAFVDDSDRLVIFSNVHFNDNESDFGGGLMSQNSSPKITESVFSSNIANWGGGFRALGGSPLIDQSVFTGNMGNSSGGAISLNAGGSAKSVPNASAEPGDMALITNSVISGNESKGETGGGGGIINEGSYLVLRNVLISGNSSDGYGGGIEFADTESALIINSTITGNQSQEFGGGVQIVDSSPTVQNSIIWNNDSIEYESARIDNFSKGAGDPMISYSLVQGCNPSGTWDIDCGTNGGDNMSDIDPLFDTGIAPGDSPTTDGDFSLTSASPVINIGENTLYTDSGGDINNDLDLAEEPRLFDGTTDVIDLGAYEFQGEPDGSEPEFAPFITTWEVEAGDLEITIPTSAGPTYNYDVDWGDGESDTGLTGDASHTYDSADTYTVKITGTFPQIEFFEADDKDKILSVEQWGDIEWASMRKAFQGATNLEINASDKPDLSNATSMLQMFTEATSVNGGLENWDVSTITSMFGLFDGATSFNGDISGWTVTEVTDMIRMFAGATSFNRDIGGWAVDKVNSMESMFDGATSFNQDLSEWNTGMVGGMGWLFNGATAFNQDLGDWDISMVTGMSGMLDGSGLSTENYDNTLIGWAAQTVQEEVELGADGLTYCNGADARDMLTGEPNSWDITGDSEATGCGAAEFAPFITTWKTDNPGISDDLSIRIPMIGNGYDFNVDWGDGNVEDYNTNPGDGVEHFLEHTYTTAGEYEVKIIGDFPRIFFNNGGQFVPNTAGDHQKIVTIEQWGDIQWSSMEEAFEGASNLTYMATDTPDLSGVTSMVRMFQGAKSFNGDIGDWNVSTITSMRSLFLGADIFNQDIGYNPDTEEGWDMSSVTDVSLMFDGAASFNQDISGWNVSNVTKMVATFYNATSFNQDLGDWDVSNVSNMLEMFDGSGLSTENYDNTLISWAALAENSGVQSEVELGAVGLTYCAGANARDTLMGEPHNWEIIGDAVSETCGAFRPFITTWEVEAGDLSINFSTSTSVYSYDYDIDWGDGKTDTGVTGDASHTYDAAGTYTVKITGIFPAMNYTGDYLADKLMTVEQWGDIEWKSMYQAFFNASSLEVNAIDTPDLSNVESLRRMFHGASSMTGAGANWEWDTSNVTHMGGMFSGAGLFNQDLSSWNTSNVVIMHNMFHGASSFNQDISGWITGNVIEMFNMFRDASSFNQNFGDWDIQKVTDMRWMLDGSDLSTANYDATLTGWADQTVKSDVELGADGLTYCEAEDDRQSLIDDHNWTISDDGLAGGCTTPDGEDQRILVSNASDYEFSKSDFGISNDAFSIKIETLPDEGTLELGGSAVNLDDEISIEDINNDDFTWDMPAEEYGYNFTSFEFRILDQDENQSDNAYTLTIDLGTVFAELSGSEGWRFMTNPSDGDSYFNLFSGITVDLDFPNRQSLYELDQSNYEWDPVGSTGDEPGVGTPFIVYVLNEDLPVTIESGDNWDDLDGSFDYNGLDFDNEGTSPNPGNFYLLGNPHPIALDFCEFIGTDIATSAYFWEPNANGGSNPDTNAGNGDYIDMNCAAPDDVLIAPFQSFWVRTTDSNPSLDIPTEAYLESPTDGYFKEPSKDSESSQDLPLISFTVTGEEGLFTNQAKILFKEDAKQTLDRYDAPKLSAEGLAEQWLSFYSMDADGIAYAFQSIPTTLLNEEKVRIPMDIRTTESGPFILDWTLPESHIFSGSYYLRDNQTGEVVELRKGSSYKFEINEQDAVKVNTDERSAKSLTDFADLGEDSSSRFELLIAGTGIDGFTELGAVPETFTLDQNYPNPFNPTTVINYQLPASSQVRLEVYDITGRQVATLVNGQVAAGRHAVNFDASNLSSGVYLYRLVAGSQIMTKKLTILK